MNDKTGARISADDLFCQDFMEKYTEFQSFLSFLQDGFAVSSLADFDAIDDAAFEQHVTKRTEFSNWEEMLETAKSHFIKKHFHHQMKP